MFRTGVLALLLALAASPASAQLGEQGEQGEHCDNDADDDGDGLADCGDPDCTGHPSCPPGGGATENTPRACQNGADDDADGRVDCDDEGCSQLIFCVGRDRPREDTRAECTNGTDDDADGEIDCDDVDCEEACALSAPVDGQPGTRGIYQPRVVERGPEVRFVEHHDPRRYPVAHVLQPMTYLSGMLVPSAGFSARRINPYLEEHLSQLGVGATYGIFDFWQITALLPVLRLSPSFDLENPAISTTVRVFSHEVIEVGVMGNVAIPIGTAEAPGPFEPLPNAHLLGRSRYSTVAQLDLSLLVRLHLGEVARVDLVVPATTLVFGSDSTGGLAVRGDLGFEWRLAFQPTRMLYLGAWGNVFVPGPSLDAPKVGLGIFAGVTIPSGPRGPIADLGLRFGWPVLWESRPAFGVDEVDPAFWQLTFDARIYTYLLP